ncbi:MAG: hypothetical protein AMJ93_05055 [Anaerolineae bacterium SM23_84]|nr:MAG: hypothetical protein AMJ93_05055 [Anaerolineae bacterium SM23_84]
MCTEELATWRDVSLVLLAAEALLTGLPVALILGASLRRLSRLMVGMRTVLFQARMYVWRTGEVTRRAMGMVAAPFIQLQSTVHGLCRALDILGWR